jgi:outer membrane protein assembly factor BamB
MLKAPHYNVKMQKGNEKMKTKLFKKSSDISTSHIETKIAAIALVLMLAVSVIIVILPAAFAHTTLSGYTPMPDRETRTEVGVSPTLVGLGQEVLINIITYPAPSGPTYEAQMAVSGLTGGYGGITITITDPDGNEETFMPIDMTLAQVGIEIPGQAQIVGHLQFLYKPTKLGTYTLTGSFPGQFYTTDTIHPTAKISVWYESSSSTVPATFTVQEDEVLAGLLNGYPWSPLPENYWENPVQVDNREWAEISGDWTQTVYDISASSYNPYSTAPNSPHIVWSKLLGVGGLPGGIWGSLPNTAGGFGAPPPIILDGRVYQNSKSGYFECFDLRTGEQLWEAPGSIDAAQRIDPAYQTAAQQAEGQIDAWLWSGVGQGFIFFSPPEWKRYDPYDGDLLQTITNAPTDIMGCRYEDGNPIVFVITADLSTWNTTLPMKISYCNLIKWDYSKVGMSNDWRNGIVWNVSVMQDDLVSIADNNFCGPKCMPYWGADVVIVKTHNAMQTMAGYSYTTGEFLWKNNATVLNNDVQPQGIATSPSGPYIMHGAAYQGFVAYDVKTGQEIWRTKSGELAWGMLPAYTFVYHDGVHFMGSYDGHVYAYDTDNGEEVWQSDYTGEEWETIYGNQPFCGGAVGADGKLYYSSATTYSMMPRIRFQTTVCIDEYTGDFIWKLPIGITPKAIADGYLVGMDADNQIEYCIGKGKTETTVSIQNDVVAAGSSVLITGTVMDMSPGAPNTPAVSDEDMSEWMDYLYGQNATLLNNPPMPDGVAVTLDAIDPSGDFVHIGDVTSDFSGMFKIMWTPDEEGEYTIIAGFGGTESYWSSYATTALGVGPASSPAVPVEPEEPTEAPFITSEVAIIAAVAVVAVIGIVAYWALRRRK